MKLHWLWLIASLVGYAQGANSQLSGDGQDATQGTVNLQRPPRLEETPWTEELYPAAIVEAWLRFFSANRVNLLQPVYGHKLSEAFVDMLKRLCRRLGLSRANGLGIVESNLQGIQMRLGSISKDFALQLKGIDELLERLQAPLKTLLDRAHPPHSYWPFFRRKSAVTIPRNPKELLLMPMQMSQDDWVQIMVRVADPMLLVLDTARMLEVTDFARFRRVFQLKFSVFIDRASAEIHRQNVFLGIPLSQRAEQRAGSRARSYLHKMISIECSRDPRAETRSAEQGAKRGALQQARVEGTTTHKASQVVRHSGEDLSRSDKRIPSSVKNYHPDEQALRALKQQHKRLFIESKDELFGALGSFCSRKELGRLVQDMVATTTVMDAYLALLVHALGDRSGTIPFRRIHSSLYTHLLGTGEENRQAARRRFTQAQLIANKEIIYLLPITLGPLWILGQIHMRPIDPSTLTLWIPVPVAEEVHRSIGELLVDRIDAYLGGDRTTILWEAVQLEFGPRHVKKEDAHMSSGLVMSIARALITGADAHQVYCHQQGVLQAAIDLLALTHVRMGS